MAVCLASTSMHACTSHLTIAFEPAENYCRTGYRIMAKRDIAACLPLLTRSNSWACNDMQAQLLLVFLAWLTTYVHYPITPLTQFLQLTA